MKTSKDNKSHQHLWRWDSSCGIVTRLQELGFESQQGQAIFLFSTTLRLALKPTQPRTKFIKWVWVKVKLSL
jgi:hypothetical protein